MRDPYLVVARRVLLPELKLLDFSYDRGTSFIEAEKVSSHEVCPRCATRSEAIYDRRWVRVKDEPIRGRQVILRLRKRRFSCRPCRRVFSEPVLGILPKRRTTQRFRQAVLWACENFKSLKDVTRHFRCSSSLIYTSLYEQLELRRKTRLYPWPEVIGIDEHSFKANWKERLSRFNTVLVDVKNRRVMELVQGKTSEILKQNLEHIPGRENVKFVVMDMCDPYRKFVREFFPNAEIVADKFHVLRLITPQILSVLKQEMPQHWERKQMRRLLLMRPQKLEFHERSRLYRYLERSPHLKELYEAKEKLFAFYSIRHSPAAGGSFEKLLERLAVSQFQELHRLKKTLEKWKPMILCYFNRRLTNGITEGFNSKIKLVKKMAYGYRSFRNFRLRVLNACAG